MQLAETFVHTVTPCILHKYSCVLAAILYELVYLGANYFHGVPTAISSGIYSIRDLIILNTKMKMCVTVGLSFVLYGSETWYLAVSKIPYILESNPHPFYSFRGLKKSDADQNRVRIRFAVESWILEKWQSRCTCPKNNTIIYYLIYYL